MLYSQVLEHEEIQKRLKAAGVAHIESLALKDGDFASFESLDSEIINKIADREILSRKNFIEYQNKLEPFKKLEQKRERIKLEFEKLIRGKFRDGFSTLEGGVINLLSKTDEDFDPETGVAESDDLSAYTELEKILKQASILNLSPTKNVEEIAAKIFYSSPYASWMK